MQERARIKDNQARQGATAQEKFSIMDEGIGECSTRPLNPTMASASNIGQRNQDDIFVDLVYDFLPTK